ncbi:MAG: hypothetical protein KDC38_10155 [Planctomycetes bacterium]|nr:hypothetical protein [Planctomycetota bacterium]
MDPRTTTLWALLTIFGAALESSEPPTSPRPSGGSPTEPASDTSTREDPELRDPTVPDPSMRRDLDEGVRAPSTERATRVLPEITLKAMIIAEGREPVALISIADRWIRVRKGSPLSLPSDDRAVRSSPDWVAEVVDVGRDGVAISVPELDRVVMVR